MQRQLQRRQRSGAPSWRASRSAAGEVVDWKGMARGMFDGAAARKGTELSSEESSGPARLQPCPRKAVRMAAHRSRERWQQCWAK